MRDARFRDARFRDAPTCDERAQAPAAAECSPVRETSGREVAR